MAPFIPAHLEGPVGWEGRGGKGGWLAPRVPEFAMRIAGGGSLEGGTVPGSRCYQGCFALLFAPPRGEGNEEVERDKEGQGGWKERFSKKKARVFSFEEGLWLGRYGGGVV